MQNSFIDYYVNSQRDIKRATHEFERQNKRDQYENYYDDQDYDDEDEDDDDCPALEEIEGNSPRKSPRKNANMARPFEERQVEKQNEKPNVSNNSNSKPKNIEMNDQNSNEKERRREERKKLIEQFNDDYLDDPSQDNFPIILNYLPKQKDKNFLDLSRTKQMTEEEQRQKAEEETKLIEKYLNKLFPESIQKENEISDEQLIVRQMDSNFELKNQLPKKIASLDNDIWKEPALKKELKDQYKKQALYLDKINMLFQDKLILKSNLREKEKKILEIQRVLRDLNDYKVSYLNQHDAEKIDLIELKYKEMNQKEITELRNKVIELEKDGSLYKQKYDIYKDKYDLIMREANEAKHVIQEQIKELLNYKKQYLKKEEELKRSQDDRGKEQIERFNNKIKQQKNQHKQSLNNTMMNQSQAIVGGQGSVDEIQQNQLLSSQNIAIPSFLQNSNDKNAYPQHPEGKRSSLLFQQGFEQQFTQQQQPQQQQQKQQPQQGQQYMSFQKSSPPNTPPMISYQIPPSPNLTHVNNQQPNPSNDQQNNEYNNNNQSQFHLNNQQQKNRMGLANLDLEHTDQTNQQQNQQLDKQAQQLIGLGGNQENQKSPLVTSTIQDSKFLNQSDQKKLKKPQVKFEDEEKPTMKTKEQEQDDYYNQLCASKIKNMVKAIQLSHSHLMEESNFYHRK